MYAYICIYICICMIHIYICKRHNNMPSTNKVFNKYICIYICICMIHIYIYAKGITICLAHTRYSINFNSLSHSLLRYSKMNYSKVISYVQLI